MVTYRISREKLPYDPSNKKSIISYTQENLVGRTLREVCDTSCYQPKSKNKGGLGQAIEYCFFLYEPNSNQEPDFPEVGMELKTTPIKRNKNKTISAKERLVITMINYCDVVNETWETSTCREKMSNVLLISYLHEADRDIFDYEIEFVGLQDFPEQDMKVISDDWNAIVNKIRDGRAHELSGGDTHYLEACTKGASSSQTQCQPFSDIKAKTRAFALKQSYMTAFYNKNLSLQAIKRIKGEENLTIEEVVKNRLSSYFGQSEHQIAEVFGISYEQKRPKDLYASLTKEMLGVGKENEIEEFSKSGIIVKAIRIEEGGTIKQHVSFPAFDFKELVSEDSWEQSELYEICSSEFLFVIFKKVGPEYLLSDCAFWTMPPDDVKKAQDTWEETKRVVSEGVELTKTLKQDGSYKLCKDGKPEISNNLPGATFNRTVHVRPHTSNRAYLLEDGTEIGNVRAHGCELPDGRIMTKQCFWFDRSYVRTQLKLKGI